MTVKVRETNVTVQDHNDFLRVLRDHRADLSNDEIDALSYCAGKCALGDVDGRASTSMLLRALAAVRQFDVVYRGRKGPRSRGYPDLPKC